MAKRPSTDGPTHGGGQFDAVDSTADSTAPHGSAPVDRSANENTADDLPMNLLAAGIPLTLLLDLAENFGPPSNQILEAEHDSVYHDPDEPAADWLSHLPTPGTAALQTPVPGARTPQDDRDTATATS
jgi:hypothetical protein